MDKEKVMDRIKKCLALSRSANEHEAAMALKQAQLLMGWYDISDDDIELSTIKTTDGGRCPKNIARWQVRLVSLVATAFGVVASRHASLGEKMKIEYKLRFNGPYPRNDLAEYAYQVLLRQLKKARADYMKNHLSHVNTQYRKKLRADDFCLGWVSSVAEKVTEFAKSEHEIKLFKKWEAEKKMSELKVKTNKSVSQVDAIRGQIAGADVEINQAVNGAEPLKQIGE